MEKAYRTSGKEILVSLVINLVLMAWFGRYAFSNPDSSRTCFASVGTDEVSSTIGDVDVTATFAFWFKVGFYLKLCNLVQSILLSVCGQAGGCLGLLMCGLSLGQAVWGAVLRYGHAGSVCSGDELDIDAMRAEIEAMRDPSLPRVAGG